MTDPVNDPNKPQVGPAPTTPGAPAADPKSAPGPGLSGVPELLRQLVDDVTVLVRKELALATAELKSSVNDAKKGVVSMISGGAVLYAGILFLLLSATYGLANVVEPWLAALIVGGIVTIIGFVMVQSGKKKMEADNFTPDRTAESIRKDRDMIERQTP